MIQINRQWLLVSCLAGLLLTTSACQSITADRRQTGTAGLNTSPPDIVITTIDHVAEIRGDFDENGLTDKAMILSSVNGWRLFVNLLQSDGSYEEMQLSAFPGRDEDWYAIPTMSLDLFLVTGDESPIDRIRLQATQREHSLEFLWDDKTRSFLAIRVHSKPAPQRRNIPDWKNLGEIVLEADVVQDSDNQSVAEVDLDPQSDAHSAMADLKFSAEGGSMVFHTLNPIGQAVAVPYGKSPPLYDDCRNAIASMSADNMPAVEPGMYFCIKTDQDMLARVWVQSLDATSNRLSLGYERWR